MPILGFYSVVVKIIRISMKTHSLNTITHVADILWDKGDREFSVEINCILSVEGKYLVVSHTHP